MHTCGSGSCEIERPADICQRCGALGQLVGRRTMESLLTPEALQRLESTSYFFDPSPFCDVVYFSNEHDSYFTKRDMRGRMGIKESEAPIPICYCFDHTVESARSEIEATGRSRWPHGSGKKFKLAIVRVRARIHRAVAALAK